jgi:hypothetical protein
MKLRLKEEPREWLKFTAAAGVFVALVGLLCRRRGILHAPVWAMFLPGILALVIGLISPRILRGPYRFVMTISFYVGQAIATVSLTLFFLAVITPMGLIMRASGKDLLHLKRRNVQSYWRQTQTKSKLDQMF